MQFCKKISVILLSAAFSASAATFDANQVEQIEKIVADYVSNHPEIIINSMKKLEHDEQEKQQMIISDIGNRIRNSDDYPMHGSKTAKHFIIEFFDFNCGYCKVMEPMFKKAVENNDLQIVYVNIPVIREESRQLAIIAQAIFELDKNKYFEFHKYFMTPGNKKQDLESVKEYCSSIGINFDNVVEKMNSRTPQVQIGKNMEDSVKLKIAGTPYMIIDGKEFRGAITSEETLKSILEGK